MDYPVVPKIDCGACNGVGQIAIEQPIPDHNHRHICKGCDGYGRRKGSRYGPKYKKAPKPNQGHSCVHCEGSGYSVEVETYINCYSCKGGGSDVGYFDVPLPWYVPDDVDLFRGASFAFWQGYSQMVSLYIATKTSLSWEEGHLGGPGMFTVVDYGDMYNTLFHDGEIAVRELVRDRIASDRGQLIKVTNRDTRVVTDKIVVKVTRNGWTPIPVDSEWRPLRNSRLGLPLSYTSDVLDRPLDG